MTTVRPFPQTNATARLADEIAEYVKGMVDADPELRERLEHVYTNAAPPDTRTDAQRYANQPNA